MQAAEAEEEKRVELKEKVTGKIILKRDHTCNWTFCTVSCNVLFNLGKKVNYINRVYISGTYSMLRVFGFILLI